MPHSCNHFRLSSTDEQSRWRIWLANNLATTSSNLTVSHLFAVERMDMQLFSHSPVLTYCLQIFDYMNVQSIHNATFANNLPVGYLNRVRALANFHEYGVFSSPQVDGIGNSMYPFRNQMTILKQFSGSCWKGYAPIHYLRLRKHC